MGRVKSRVQPLKYRKLRTRSSSVQPWRDTGKVGTTIKGKRAVLNPDGSVNHYVEPRNRRGNRLDYR